MKFSQELKRRQNKLNNYSLLFGEDGYLLSIKRNDRFYKFKEVLPIKDLITNLGTDKLTISDLYQVIGQFREPMVDILDDGRILVKDIIL